MAEPEFQLRDTPYAEERARADVDDARIERLFIKEEGHEEIRFSWWKDGKMAPRPLDLPEPHLLRLMREAIANGVFSDDFIDGLLGTLIRHSHHT